MAEDQQAEGQKGKSMERPRRISRRDLLAGALGAAAGVVGREVLGKVLPESKERGKVIKLPAIVGMVYKEGPELGLGTYTPYRDFDKPLPEYEIALVQVEKPQGSGQTVAKTKTKKDGVYIFEGVQPGLYRLHTTASGTPESKGYTLQGKGSGEEIEITPETTIVLGPIWGKLD